MGLCLVTAEGSALPAGGDRRTRRRPRGSPDGHQDTIRMLADFRSPLGDFPIDATKDPLYVNDHTIALATLVAGRSANQPARRFLRQVIHWDALASRNDDLVIAVSRHCLLGTILDCALWDTHCCPLSCKTKRYSTSQ